MSLRYTEASLEVLGTVSASVSACFTGCWQETMGISTAPYTRITGASLEIAGKTNPPASRFTGAYLEVLATHSPDMTWID